jgi:folate-binding protein YgfZ
VREIAREATQMTTTESIPATAVQPTVLARHLATETIPYLGTLTPCQLDAPKTETGALLFGAAVHDLGWLRRVAVRGEDRFRWLSGMVTNAVESMPDRTGAYNLVLNAQGRIQGDCCTWRDGDAIDLVITAEQSEVLLTHLDRFIIMDDVELVPLTNESALGITGPQAETILAKLGLPALPDELSSAAGAAAGVPVRLYRGYGPAVPHYELWTASEQIPALWQAILAAGATPAGAASLEALRIYEGIPAYGIDIQSRDLAQETSQMRAISFTKGCYLGQEIVERIRSRGQVHRHLRALELTPDATAELPAAGTELRIAGSTAETKPAGSLTSVAALQPDGARRIFAIGMIRAEAETGSQLLAYQDQNQGGTAKILHSPPKWTRP